MELAVDGDEGTRDVNNLAKFLMVIACNGVTACVQLAARMVASATSSLIMPIQQKQALTWIYNIKTDTQNEGHVGCYPLILEPK